MAVSVAEFGERQRDDLARADHHVAIDQDILDLTAVGPAVHPHEAANGAGDRAEEFEAGDAMIARRGGDEDARGPAAAVERDFIDALDARERLAEADDNAGDAAIADDQIGAEAERHDRNFGRETGDEVLQIGHVLRLEQPLRGAAGLEPDQRG